MQHASSRPDRRERPQRALALALLALALLGQLVAPGATFARLAAPAGTVVICTSEGARRLALPGAQPAPVHAGHELCLACCLATSSHPPFCPASVAEPWPRPAPILWQPALDAAPAALGRPDRPPARAPPLPLV
jgi:hypothetical protein